MKIILEEAMRNTRSFNTDSSRYGRLIVNEHVSPPEVMVVVMKEGQKVEPVHKEPVGSSEVRQYLVGDEPATSLIHKVLSSVSER